jgi:hypothetical protein
MGRSTKISELEEEEEEEEEEQEVYVEKEEQVVPKSAVYSSFEQFKFYLIENLKEILLISFVVMLSNHKQVTSLVESFNFTDNEYLLLLLKGVVSSGLILSMKAYLKNQTNYM